VFSTCHTTTAAISIGLPARSFTLSFCPFMLRARSEILRRCVNGFTQKNPFVFTEPA
jgi:hypothetical protein